MSDWRTKTSLSIVLAIIMGFLIVGFSLFKFAQHKGVIADYHLLELEKSFPKGSNHTDLIAFLEKHDYELMRFEAKRRWCRDSGCSMWGGATGSKDDEAANLSCPEQHCRIFVAVKRQRGIRGIWQHIFQLYWSESNGKVIEIFSHDFIYMGNK